jgi:hypothetical protein
MVREALAPSDVLAQSEQAILEIGARLDDLAPRPLWKRHHKMDFRQRTQ